MMNTLIALFGLASAFAASSTARAPSRLFMIILENTDASVAESQPFLAKLAREGTYLSEFHAITHPSYPNYLALASGDTWGVTTDSLRTIEGAHLGNLLEAKGRSWKTYAEGYPGGCYLGATKGYYARRHVPMLSFRDVQSNPERCARVVGAEQLKADIEKGTLPDFSLYIPDNRDNGHDTGPVAADQWLAREFGPLLKDPRFTQGLVFVVTFDESAGGRSNRIYTSFWGESVRPGVKLPGRYDHYSLLRFVEDFFGLGTLGRKDETAAQITGVLAK